MSSIHLNVINFEAKSQLKDDPGGVTKEGKDV